MDEYGGTLLGMLAAYQFVQAPASLLRADVHR